MGFAGIRRHIEMHKAQTTLCHECGKWVNVRFPSRAQITVTAFHPFHVQTDEHEAYPCEVKYENYCGHCKVSFKTEAQIKRHLAEEHGEEFFENLKVQKAEALKRLAEKQPKSKPPIVKPFRCRYGSCGKTFANKGNRQRHERIFHEQPDMYRCPTCLQCTGPTERALTTKMRAKGCARILMCRFCDHQIRQTFGVTGLQDIELVTRHVVLYCDKIPRGMYSFHGTSSKFINCTYDDSR